MYSENMAKIALNAVLNALQKQLNRSRCHFSCGLGWAQGTVF